MSLLADQKVIKWPMINLQTQKDAQSWVKRPQLRQLSHNLSTKLSTSETQQSKLAKLAAKLRFRAQ